MLYKIIFFSFLIGGILSQSVSAQQTEQTQGDFVVDKNQPVNGILDLPKPDFSEEAKKNKIFGKVEVEVRINKAGNVVSASAVSGPEPLRTSAEQAALKSKFKPTLLAEIPVEVTGIIVYNFLPPKINWFLIGLGLLQIQQKSTLKGYNPAAISEQINSEWTLEKEKFDKLEQFKKAETESDKSFSPVGVSASAKDLILSLEKRLTNEPENLKIFDFGIAFGEAFANYNENATSTETADRLEQNLTRLPAAVSPDFKSKAETIISILRRESASKADSDELIKNYAELLKTPPVK